MAKTYTAASIGQTFGNGKSMMSLINAHATRKVKLYRVWQLNNQTTGITGALCTMALRRANTITGGTAITPVAHDTGNVAFDLTSITCAFNASATPTGDNPLRTWIWSSDEPALATATQDEFQCLVPLNCIWDSTGDSNIEPIVLNTNEGIHIICANNVTTGISDIFMEFTVS